MESKDVYIQKQKFLPVWHVLLIILLIAIVYIYPVRQIINESFVLSSLIPVGILLLILVFFYTASFTIKISEAGISYRFIPVQFNYRELRQNDIKSIEVVDYDALSEYGGWGLRYKRNTTAYLFKGTTGILITKTSGKRVLLGTHNSRDEMVRLLQKYKYI